MSEKESKYQQAFDVYAGAVKRTAYFTAAAGKAALRPLIWGLEFPAKLRPPIERRIQAELPRSEAKIAQDTIIRGRGHQDKELISMGENMMVNAVQLATTQRIVPPEVREEVLQKACDIDLKPENTDIDPFVTRHVQEVLNDFKGDQP